MNRSFIKILVVSILFNVSACNSPVQNVPDAPHAPATEQIEEGEIATETITPTQKATTPVISETPENQISAEVEHILLTMLNSHTLWDSVKGTAELNWFYSSGNPKDTYFIDFFIEQPDVAYIDTRSKVGLGLPNLFITDGEMRYVVVEELKGYYQTEQDDISSQIASLPTSLDEVANVYLNAWKEGHHPFASGIFSPIESFLYPQWFAYRNLDNTYTLFGRQICLERNVWVVGYTNDRETDLAWVDDETGLILKFLGDYPQRIEMEITSIEFNVDQEAANLDFLAGLENLGDQLAAQYVCFNAPICSWGPPKE